MFFTFILRNYFFKIIFNSIFEKICYLDFMQLKPEDLIGESNRTIEDVQNERKEYVKNIGIEYRYGCYEVNFR